MKRAYYTVLKYCPDPVRGESVNMGILAVGAHSFRFQCLDRFSHLRGYWGDVNEGRLFQHQAEVQRFFTQRHFHILQSDGQRRPTNRLSLDVLKEFTSRFSGPGLFYSQICRVEGNIDSSFALDSLTTDLFEQIVQRKQAAPTPAKKRKERVKTILKNEFDACDFFNSEKYRHPLQADRNLELPGRGYNLPMSFSFDNGTVHVFEPIDALEQESLNELREVALVAMIFQKLRDELGNRVKTYACLVRPPSNRQLREIRILREHAKIIDLTKKSKTEAFYLKMHKWLGPRSPEFLQF
jgi:hypothetical protein